MRSKALVIKLFVVIGVASLVFLVGCGGGASQSFHNQPPPPTGSNPAPSITTLSPNTSVAGGAAFTLTITGTNFVTASVVNLGTTAPTTTFVSATQLTAVIPAAAIALGGTVAVSVTNPAPGGGTSNEVNFTITSGTNPVPTIATLNPSGAIVGGVAFTVGVDGFDFSSSSVVQWNGSDRLTTFVGSGFLTAQISATDIAATGTAAVTVFNPTPGGGSSNALTFTIAKGGVSPDSIAVDPTGKFAYVANSGTNNVSMYTINGTTGALTFIGRIAAGIGPASVTVDPSGKFVYVANESNSDDLAGNVSMYTINSTTGALTSIASPVAADFGAHLVGVDPRSKFAYVANDGIFQETGGSLSTYTINSSTGALTPTGTISGVCGSADNVCAPLSVAVDPSGMFLYVANEGGPAPTFVSMYIINTTTGALTPIGGVGSGGRAVSVAVDPRGKFAYVANSSNGSPAASNIVSMYTINAGTGGLTLIGTIAAGTDPSAVAVDPGGKFAYVANSGSNDVSMYTINATTGSLTSMGTITAGLSPTSIAIRPSGKFAYVTNSGSNDVSMYSIDAATGALVLMGTTGT
jgi:YVTN family beta-propeller protein